MDNETAIKIAMEQIVSYEKYPTEYRIARFLFLKGVKSRELYEQWFNIETLDIKQSQMSNVVNALSDLEKFGSIPAQAGKNNSARLKDIPNLPGL